MEPTRPGRESDPPRLIEKVAAFLIPRASREQVLGDLHELYSSPLKYILDVVRLVPWVISNRARSRLNRPILANRGRAMFKIGVTCLLVGMFIALMTRLALNGLFIPADWTEGLWIFTAVTLLIVLVLLSLRAVWRSSPQVLQGLYWPTATAGGIVGLAGIVMLMRTAWLGRQTGEMKFLLMSSCGIVVMIGCLTTYALWRTKEPGRVSS